MILSCLKSARKSNNTLLVSELNNQSNENRFFYSSSKQFDKLISLHSKENIIPLNSEYNIKYVFDAVKTLLWILFQVSTVQLAVRLTFSTLKVKSDGSYSVRC